MTKLIDRKGQTRHKALPPRQLLAAAKHLIELAEKQPNLHRKAKLLADARNLKVLARVHHLKALAGQGRA